MFFANILFAHISAVSPFWLYAFVPSSKALQGLLAFVLAFL